MKHVRWTAPAKDQLDEWIAYLTSEAGERIAKRAYSEVTQRARELVDFPEKCRASEIWHGLRELPLSDWKKLLVYRIDSDVIRVLAFYDQRRDLSAAQPPSE